MYCVLVSFDDARLDGCGQFGFRTAGDLSPFLFQAKFDSVDIPRFRYLKELLKLA
jgi:hypothetical protein